MSTPPAGPTHPSERRFDRGSWLSLIVMLGFMATCATVAVLDLSQPGDGCLLSIEGTVYACVGDWTTPLQPGDRPLQVGGLTIEAVLLRRDHERLVAQAQSATLPYVVDRGGTRLELSVPLGQLDTPGLLRALGAGLGYNGRNFLVYSFIGAVIIFGLAPRARAAQLLLVGLGSAAAVTTVLFSTESVGTILLMPWPLYVASTVLATFWSWLLLPLLLLLVLTFPRRVWPLTRWPRLAPIALVGAPLGALLVTLITGEESFYLVSLGLGALAFLIATIVVTVSTLRHVPDPVIHAQTTWMSLGLLLGIGIWPLLFVFDVIADGFGGGMGDRPPVVAAALELGSAGIFLTCLGIAITRYRLFDIDIVINRTLVYALLTGALVTVYIVGVILVQSLFRILTSQETDLAIVASTLAVAVLFQPLRTRIQGFIDRRFFRRRYDAARILAAYAAMLRDDIHLEHLAHELVRVANETLRPAHLALWLPEASGSEAASALQEGERHGSATR